MTADILQELDDKMKGIENKTGKSVKEEKEKIQRLAHKHNLDSGHVEDWPEEIKSQL